VAKEAGLKGFDEIQFDYLRFPTDGKLSAARYSKANTQETRLAAISQFLTRARAALEPTGASLAIDLFGYTAFNLDDTGVGQRIEELAPLVDAFCPMAYPSAYHLGIPNYRNPVAHPYEVVFETVRRMRERSAHTRAQVRPWIQDFRDYAFDRRPFGYRRFGPRRRPPRMQAALGGCSGTLTTPIPSTPWLRPSTSPDRGRQRRRREDVKTGEPCDPPVFREANMVDDPRLELVTPGT
jgi:hypothetical protein